MKKIFAILTSVALILSLSACGMNGTDDKNRNGESSLGDTISSQLTDNSDKLSNNQQSNDKTKITADEALKIALNEAGVSKDNIRDLESKLDRDNGVLVYEIDFESGNTEYSYDINANTGEIVERDRDFEN